jgi:hypothetical protein
MVQQQHRNNRAKGRRVRTHVPAHFVFANAVSDVGVCAVYFIGAKKKGGRTTHAHRVVSSSSFSSIIISFIYSAAGDLGLHHGLDGLSVLVCDANGELIERGHHGVMIEVSSTGDSSATEVQAFQFLQFRNGRWYLCNTQQESAAITG